LILSRGTKGVTIMSLVIERFLKCDGPGCDKTFGIDMRHMSASKHRTEAKKEGWRIRDGKDYCPKCTRKRDALNKRSRLAGSMFRSRIT